MHLRRSGLIAVLFVLVAALAAACGGSEPSGAPECFVTQDGRVVGATGPDCEAPAGATVEPTPTFTPVPSNGGDTLSPAVALLITNGCAGCHAIESVPQAQGQVGPALTGIGSRGDAYVRESIVDPNAVIAEGYASGLMPLDFGTRLSAADIDTLVEFLVAQ